MKLKLSFIHSTSVNTGLQYTAYFTLGFISTNVHGQLSVADNINCDNQNFNKSINYFILYKLTLYIIIYNAWLIFVLFSSYSKFKLLWYK